VESGGPLPDELGYCVQCKKKRVMKNVVQLPMSKRFRVNKFALRGVCEKCDTVMFKLVKNQNYQYPLSKIEDELTEDSFENLKEFDEEQTNEPLNDKIEILQTLKDDLSIPPEPREYIKMEYERAVRNIDFRKRILSVYNHACAICGIQLSLIEAAHIVPVSEGGTDELTNGIALCSNHHRAFDMNLIYINENLEICLNSQKITELSNSNFHMGLEEFTRNSNSGKKIKVPVETNYHPDLKYIIDRLKLMDMNLT
jgi:hypothetical protein